MTDKDKLIGTWRLDPNDIAAYKVYGDVTPEFKKNGDLKYIIHSGSKDEIMLLTYDVSGAELITDQPSHPNKARTKFRFESDEVVKLYFDGVESTFIKS